MADSNFGLKIGLEGEKEFKAALSEINQSFKVLGSEMKLVQSQFDKDDNSVEALTARNQVLNKEIEAQKQKIETLRAALDNAAESFGENDRRTQNWQIQLNNAEAALNSMERELSGNEQAIQGMTDEMDAAGDSTGDFADALEDSGDSVDDAGSKFEKLKSVLGTIGKATVAAVTAIGTAAVAAGKAIWDMANETASAGDKIDKTSQKIGISAEAYQEWAYVFERSGANVDNLQAGMKTLSGVISDAATGSKSATEKLNAVGLSIKDLNGLSQEQQLDVVITALQEMSSGAERTSAATDLLGKSATDMAAVLNMTAEDTAALKKEAQDYGMVMSNEAVAASAAFEDSLSRLNNTFGGLKNRITSDMLPGLISLMDGFSDLIAGDDNAAEEIESGVTSMIEGISAMVPQVVTLVSTIAEAVLAGAPAIIQALAQGILEAVPELMPTITEVITQLIAALVELLPMLIEAGMQIIVSLAQGIAEAVPELIPQVVEIVTQIVQTLIENLPLLLDAALQLITGLAEGLLEAIPVLIEALPDIITAIIEFLIDAIPQIIDAGIQLLTSLVDALPEIIEAVVEAIPQIIDGLVTAITEGIPQIIDAGVKLLVALIQNLPKIITAVVTAIPQIVTSLVKAIVDSIPKLVEAGVKLLTSLVKNLPTIIVEIVKAVPQIITGIVNAFTSGMGRIVEIGGNIVKGLWQGIQSLAGWLWDKVSGWITSIWDGICDFFGIASPSKEMGWIGEMLVQGLASSIDTNGRDAVRSAEHLAGDINSVMNGLAADMQTVLPTDISVHGTSGLGSASQNGNPITIHIGTLTVREEADVGRIAQQLYELERRELRKKGVAFA